ncbi:hypothetical protein HU175_04185 [Spirosoma sp. KUDC1026]|nr:hypothetical protein HU175_04185 [Spirosoma sp. KUDC1026]
MLTGFLASCGGKKVAPVSERIAKVWTAQRAEENSTTVYTRGGTSNAKPGYSAFKLDLSNPPVARYNAFDGNLFVGQYSLTSDTRLVLTNLNPAPSESGGTLEFDISDLTDNSVVLTRISGDRKTGGTINKYTLSNP